MTVTVTVSRHCLNDLESILGSGTVTVTVTLSLRCLFVTYWAFGVFDQLSVEVQQDQGIRMRVALGVYIIADGVPGGNLRRRKPPGAPDSTLV